MITTQYRDEVYARALQYNKTNGRCMTAMRKVFDTALSNGYADGTNIVVEFIREMLGLPYGDNGLSLDYRADCSQLVINLLKYFWNVYYSWSYTQAIYNNRNNGNVIFDYRIDGTFDDDSILTTAPNLSIIGYKFSDRNPDLTHVSIKCNASQIAHTRSTSKPLMFDNVLYESDASLKLIVDFLTPEQHLQVLVGDVDYDYTSPVLKKNTQESITVDDIKSRDLFFAVPMLKGDDVKMAQSLLIANGYSCGKSGADGVFGKNTNIAKEKYQTAKGVNTKKPLNITLV